MNLIDSRNEYFSDCCIEENMTGGSDSTNNIRTSEIKLQEVRQDLILSLR